VTTEEPGFIAGGGDYTSWTIVADEKGLAPKFRMIPLFHGGEEGIHVKMKNGAKRKHERHYTCGWSMGSVLHLRPVIDPEARLSTAALPTAKHKCSDNDLLIRVADPPNVGEGTRRPGNFLQTKTRRDGEDSEGMRVFAYSGIGESTNSLFLRPIIALNLEMEGIGKPRC